MFLLALIHGVMGELFRLPEVRASSIAVLFMNRDGETYKGEKSWPVLRRAFAFGE
jgi:hypothetical protein